MSDVVILAVDSDQTVLSFVRRHSTRRGYLFCGARRGEDALRKAREVHPDVVLSRVRLPDMSGRELVARFQSDVDPARGGQGTPLVMTGLRGQESEAAAALEQGAVGVLFFPFSEAEMMGRLGSLVRWARRPSGRGVLEVGAVSVDFDRGELIRPQPQPLTASELEILRWLLNPPGRAVTATPDPVGSGAGGRRPCRFAAFEVGEGVELHRDATRNRLSVSRGRNFIAFALFIP